jgi:hypothetical protein
MDARSPTVPRFPPARPGSGRTTLACDDARKFIRFLPFGLTLRSGGLTVTVRNRYF